MQDESSRRIEGGHLQRLTIWAATFDPDGAVHRMCCHDVCTQLREARACGLLEAVARHEACSAAVIAGVYLCLEEMVKHAMEAGLLDHVAGMTVCPTGL